MHRLRPLRSFTAFSLAVLGARAEIIGMDTFDLPDGPAHGKVSGAFWDYHQTSGHKGESAPWCALSGDPLFRGGRLVTPATSKAMRTFAFAPLSGRKPGYWHNKPGQVYDGIVPVRGSIFLSARVQTTHPDTGVGVHFYDWTTERIYIGTLRGEGQPRQWGVELGKSDGNSPKEGEMGAFPSGLALEPGKPVHVICEVNWPQKILRLWLDPAPGARATPTFTRPYSGRNWITACALSSFGQGEASWDELAVTTLWEDLP